MVGYVGRREKNIPTGDRLKFDLGTYGSGLFLFWLNSDFRSALRQQWLRLATNKLQLIQCLKEHQNCLRRSYRCRTRGWRNKQIDWSDSPVDLTGCVRISDL